MLTCKTCSITSTGTEMATLVSMISLNCCLLRWLLCRMIDTIRLPGRYSTKF